MEQSPLNTDQVVAGVLARWPQTIRVFLRHHLICVGCAMSRFETLGEIAAIYGLDLSGFLGELRQAIEAAPGDSPELECEANL
jgi:hybrid cluster-associated redox disulfide protein